MFRIEEGILDTKLSDVVAKAIVTLPRKALSVLLLVVAVQGHSSLLALARLPVCLHGRPESMGLDASHLPDQTIQGLHL